tara:strand:- start:1032 stop:1397 length:366 start_codon:yes stop_codon:yes gene_type:complete
MSIFSCTSCNLISTRISVIAIYFGTTGEGKEITYCELSNGSRMTVRIINYVGIITKIIVLDKSGNFGDVVLGHDNIKNYEEKIDHFGCIAGRYANRICKEQFSLGRINISYLLITMSILCM